MFGGRQKSDAAGVEGTVRHVAHTSLPAGSVICLQKGVVVRAGNFRRADLV
jgi:hypothetical protein